jgi:hypothetical protein
VTRKVRDPVDRFREKYRVAVSGCWIWEGAKNRTGYGQIALGTKEGGDKRRVLAHRFAYEMLRGPIPEGLSLDHLCRTPACVNPAHLEPVTHAENMRRSRGFRRKTHCAQGHALTPDNLVPRAGKEGQFRCKTCLDVARRESAERNRDQRLVRQVAFREANRERLTLAARERARARRVANPDGIRAYQQAWRAANREHVNAQAREYQRRRRTGG